ncbi:MAG: metallophosphoesterase [Gemmatimonas sp.]
MAHAHHHDHDRHNLEHDHSEDASSVGANDGVDRRGFLRCMAWAGTGVVWAINGGVPRAYAMNAIDQLSDAQKKALFFAQISDSHIGFNKAANQDVTATLRLAVDRLNALPTPPALVLHTGDITQLSKAEEFDTASEVIKGIKTGEVFYVPGEHDVLSDNGAQYLKRFGRGSSKGWYSFDHTGVHFVGLVNVMDLKAGGLGALGAEQLEWLKKDLQGLSASTPIVVFAHIPLWSIYPEWGWGTDDSAQALALLKRFGSVTVLNGHIHQTMQKVEGNVHFHTALSTAFPQPAPGSAPSPGPMTVSAERLQHVLGLTSVTFVPGKHDLAIVDTTLTGEATMAGSMAMEHATGKPKRLDNSKLPPGTISIDNFQFNPKSATVKAGTEVMWINRDDVPHLVISANGKFPSSRIVDTDQKYTQRFMTPGEYPYFCSLHPQMTGRIIVT